MKKISPLVKGAITSVVMIVIGLSLHFADASVSTGLQFLGLIIYAGGIAWTLIDYARSAEFTGKFGDIFQQGFKCFIIVTLVMIAYVSIFYKMNPKLIEDHLAEFKVELTKNEKSRTPQEIDTMVETARKGYITSMVSNSIFSNLLVGAVFTLAGTGIILLRKKQ